jgi:hypothetical protein
VSWGVIPAVAFGEIRTTGEGLNFNIANIVSNEIRSDRQITDLVQVDADATGPINAELSYGTYDDWLEGALFSSGWATVGSTTGTNIDAAAADNSFNQAAGDWSSTYAAGQWIRVVGFTEAANNGFFRVVSVTATKLVVSGGTLVLEAAGDSVTIDNDGYIVNGTTESSFTIEKFFSDKTQYHTFAGCIVNEATLNLEVGEILTASFDFLGKDMVRDTATAGTGAYTAATTTDVMNAVGNVASVRENGTEIAAPVFIRSLSVTINNNLRGIKAIANLGNVDVGAGRGLITGTLQVYFENGAFVDTYLNGTETSIDFRVADAAGNTYIVTLPRIKFISQEIVAGAIDQDVVIDMEFQAIRDQTDTWTLQIDRFAA